MRVEIKITPAADDRGIPMMKRAPRDLVRARISITAPRHFWHEEAALLDDEWQTYFPPHQTDSLTLILYVTQAGFIHFVQGGQGHILLPLQDDGMGDLIGQIFEQHVDTTCSDDVKLIDLPHDASYSIWYPSLPATISSILSRMCQFHETSDLCSYVCNLLRSDPTAVLPHVLLKQAADCLHSNPAATQQQLQSFTHPNRSPQLASFFASIAPTLPTGAAPVASLPSEGEPAPTSNTIAGALLSPSCCFESGSPS